jgi:hypothetical protein
MQDTANQDRLRQSQSTMNHTRGPTFGDFDTILTDGRRRTTRCKTTEYLYKSTYRLSSPLPPLINVMYCVRVSLRTVKNILCATLKRGGRG